MKFLQPVKIGPWILILLNLFMSFGSIWIFTRMAPAIEVILQKNQLSLQASEKMLTSLLLHHSAATNDPALRESFRNAYLLAKNNITEQDESVIIDAISQHFENAFKGNRQALDQTIQALQNLSEINREAMKKADNKAQQLGYAGAWGVMFMASIIFLVEMVLLRSLKSYLINPLQEIDTVISAFLSGETIRRCTLKNPPKMIRHLFRNMNELLDRSMTDELARNQRSLSSEKGSSGLPTGS